MDRNSVSRVSLVSLALQLINRSMCNGGVENRSFHDGAISALINIIIEYKVPGVGSNAH